MRKCNTFGSWTIDEKSEFAIGLTQKKHLELNKQVDTKSKNNKTQPIQKKEEKQVKQKEKT